MSQISVLSSSKCQHVRFDSLGTGDYYIMLPLCVVRILYENQTMQYHFLIYRLMHAINGKSLKTLKIIKTITAGSLYAKCVYDKNNYFCTCLLHFVCFGQQQY